MKKTIIIIVSDKNVERGLTLTRKQRVRTFVWGMIFYRVPQKIKYLSRTFNQYTSSGLFALIFTSNLAS